MYYEPKTKAEESFKKLLTDAIKSGLKDFYRPKLDPSFNSAGGICYAQGMMPAVGKSYNWWKKTAIEFSPERGSRLGTKTEYVAFLGVLLKKLVNMGCPKAKAWSAVCNDFIELNNYWHCELTETDFETTCNIEIVGYYDLANTFKILAKDEKNDVFWMAGGTCNIYTNFCLISTLFF